MLEYIFYLFFCAICMLLMYFLNQKGVAYAIGIIVIMATFSHLHGWYSQSKSELNENLTKIQSITNNIYGTVDKIDKLSGTSNSKDGKWYYNNPVQKGTNGIYKYITGKNPKMLKKE